MEAFGFLLVQIARFLHIIFRGYTWIIVIVAVLSWVQPNPYNPLVRFLGQITNPVFRLVRNRLPASWFRSGLDFSPVIVLLLLLAIDMILIQLLFKFGLQMQQKVYTS